MHSELINFIYVIGVWSPPGPIDQFSVCPVIMIMIMIMVQRPQKYNTHTVYSNLIIVTGWLYSDWE